VFSFINTLTAQWPIAQIPQN